MKITVIELKNSIYGLNIRSDTAEERINELKDGLVLKKIEVRGKKVYPRSPKDTAGHR